MLEEMIYMLGVVTVGFAVNYTLRALPFLLFAGRDRALPPWVERLGSVISPVIIGALILYAYSGLAWKTAWPYLAGAVTIALHLWRRNALLSIVAGTAVYMCLVSCGCATKYDDLALDRAHPSIVYDDDRLLIGERVVSPDEVLDILEHYEIPTERPIHIRVTAAGMRNLHPARGLMGYLSHHGYHRVALVTDRHAEGGTAKELENARR